MEFKVSSTNETEELARKLAKKLTGGEVIALFGDLGAGKTTFTGFLAAALGFSTRVQSPTFVIHRIYQKERGDIKKIHHIDLYRIQSEEAFFELDLDETFSEKNAIVLIEWPECIQNRLPENTIKVYFEHLEDDQRRIKLEGIDL